MITTQRCPCTLTIGNQTWVSEREVTRIDDWRETIIGWVNFGHTHLGPQRWSPCPKPTDKVD